MSEPLISSIVTGTFGLLTPIIVAGFMAWLTYRTNQIHKLVNNAMTISMQARLTAMEVSRRLMWENISLKTTDSAPPPPERLAELADLDVKIGEAQAELSKRAAQEGKSK